MQMVTTFRYNVIQPKFPYRMIPQRMDQSAVRTRLRRLIAETADGKQQVFAEMVDIQASMLSKLLSGREQIGARHLMKIEKSTGARLAWLETGIDPVYYEGKKAPERAEVEHYEGYRLRQYLDTHNIEYSELSRRMDKAKNTVQGYFKVENFSKPIRQAILEALNDTYENVFGFSGGSNPKAKLQPVKVYDDSDQDDPELVDVTDVPIAARAGFGYQAFIQGLDRTTTKVPSYMLHPGHKAPEHVIVTINGDSMEPQLQPGFRMLAYRLPPNLWPRLHTIVMVDYRDELIIKELAGIDDVNHTILLRSKNGGATLNISMDEIRSVYHVYRYYDAKLM